MPQTKRDAVHRYFEYNESTSTSKCQLCDNKLKGKHATNLKNHLAAKHLDEYSVVCNINKDLAQASTSNDKSVEILHIVEKIKRLCVQLVTVHGRPLAMMEDAAFQELINMVAPNKDISKNINIKAIKKCIQNEATEIRRKISNDVKDQLISLKVDAVTCQERKFIGINIQYIKGINMTIRNLAVCEIYDRQTASFLKITLEEIISEFKISMDQIYCICTDNGSNMVKMVKVMDGQYCSNNAEEEVITDEDEEDDTTIASRNDDNMIGNDINNMFMDLDIENFSVNDTFKVRGMLCAAHTLQLAIKDAFNSDVLANTTLNLARKVINILRKPNIVNLIKRRNLKKPIKDCPTRWSSTFNLLNRLLALREFCESVTEITALVSDAFWSEVENLIIDLKPAKEATTILQRSQLTIGDFFITWLNCKNHLKTIQHYFAQTLYACMENRERKLMENDVVLEGLYLDGRLNVILSSEQSQKARRLLNEVHQQIQLLTERSTRSHETESEVPAPTPGTSRNCSGLEEMLANAERARGVSRGRRSFDHCLLEIVTIPRLELTENMIAYWENKIVASSELAKVAKVILSAPATQVSVERLFSSLKFILHPLRSNLNSMFLKDLMLVRENKDLL